MVFTDESARKLKAVAYRYAEIAEQANF